MLLFTGFVYLAYCILLLLFIKGWHRLAPSSTQSDHTVSLSVVIPFKNEQVNIGMLCLQLESQSLDSQLFEVFFVDDGSTDGGTVIVASFCENNPHFTLLKNNGSGKKNAISTALEQVNHAMVLTLDADITIGRNHLAAFSSFIYESPVDLVIGPVHMCGNSNSLWNQFQMVEFHSLAASTAGSAGLNHAIMCNGANLLFNRLSLDDAYLATVKENVASGDDMFLLEYARKNNWQIAYLKNMDALAEISTISPKQFLRQRKRWASKALHYQLPDIVASGFVVALFNFLLVFNLGAVFYSVEWAYVLILGLLSKTMLDHSLFAASAKFFSTEHLLSKVWLFELFYPFYVLITLLTAIFIRSDWKKK